MKVYIGLDIGGTKISGALITEQGNILRLLVTPTEAEKSNAVILRNICHLIDMLKEKTVIHGIGIGVAGHIDHVRNMIADGGPNFRPSFKRIHLVSDLFQRYHVPIVLENDANVYALGEAIFGRGKGYRLVVGVTLGTGIGAGIVQDGKIMHGKNNLAGEVGHMFTRDSRKTWERVAAGEAFNEHHNLHRGSRALAEGFHNILHVLDPDIVVVGGGLARVPRLVSATKTETHKRLIYQALADTPIVKTSLGRRAPILGAMLLIRDRK